MAIDPTIAAIAALDDNWVIQRFDGGRWSSPTATCDRFSSLRIPTFSVGQVEIDAALAAGDVVPFRTEGGRVAAVRLASAGAVVSLMTECTVGTAEV